MKRLLLIIVTIIVLIGGRVVTSGYRTATIPAPPAITSPDASAPVRPAATIRDDLAARYASVRTRQWGEQVTGVIYRLDTGDKVLALTLDACGGPGSGSGFDEELIDFLVAEQIPATLFVSGTWIAANPEAFRHLADLDLFTIGNHGGRHLPASTNGSSAYGIQGSRNARELIDDIMADDADIKSYTGTTPKYYRSGTNFYDEAAVAIARELGYATVGYTISGDAGATFNRQQINKTLLASPTGSIILMHFNHPEGQSAEGLRDAVPLLKKQGFRFVRLSDYPPVVYR